MIGPGAVRPGDVISHPRGRYFTEVADTDSEGRIILADAIDWLCSQSLDLIVMSALTDGGGVGPELWGCWSASAEQFLPKLLKAVRRRGSSATPAVAGFLCFDTESRIADSINAPLDRPWILGRLLLLS
ncbi:MAG: hypothetical protein KIT06_00840 [Cryobacterium sp.]|nr:hypothetical protein [Cryobacterium sp.]